MEQRAPLLTREVKEKAAAGEKTEASEFAEGSLPWRSCLPHVCVAAMGSFLVGYHSGAPLSFTPYSSLQAIRSLIPPSNIHLAARSSLPRHPESCKMAESSSTPSLKARYHTIDKLNGNNYQVWKLKMELYLKELQLWNVVSTPAPSTVLTEWMTKDNTAHMEIILHCEIDKCKWYGLLNRQKLYGLSFRRQMSTLA
ncbi:hypothetical protein L7F22_030327 [Adiantum nelumboides]|nr:hypothetical protein [Adiantum nelumboides]